MEKSPPLIVIVGPTASGKSALAINIALYLKTQGVIAEIISADSRQVYIGLDSGTGKITKKEMRGVPHHLLDIASPKRQYTVANYKKDAEKVIQEIAGRGNVAIVCGGTGFYIQALVDDILLPDVPPNKKLRAKLEKENTETLFKKLKKLDPRRGTQMVKNGDFKNKRRIIRAIEIVTKIGAVPKIQKKSPLKALWIGISLLPEILQKKINTRLKARLKAGMISEVKNLHKKGLPWKRMYELGLEYRFVSAYLQSKQTKKDYTEMIEKLSKEIWHYAKRQMTWWKKDSRIHWISPKMPISKILKLIDYT